MGTERNPCYSPRILLVDAYDSFTNNIVGLLEQKLDAEVIVVHIDNVEVTANLEDVLKAFDAVVVGPGPGDPTKAADVGLITQLWTLNESALLPIFGICLGFQSLGLAYGASIRRLDNPQHGIVSKISHINEDIFQGLEQFNATQYHSLYVDIGDNVSDGNACDSTIWEPTTSCPLLKPLAWRFEDSGKEVTLMALRHTEKPFWAVQFHPESICTSRDGSNLLGSWWSHARNWLDSRKRLADLNSFWYFRLQHQMYSAGQTSSGLSFGQLAHNLSVLSNTRRELHWKWTPLGRNSVIDIIETLDMPDKHFILLDSQGHSSGRYSIIGLADESSSRFEYRVQDKRLSCRGRQNEHWQMQLESSRDIWTVLENVLDLNCPQQSFEQLPSDCPFWGGFMGYISYEGGLDCIDLQFPQAENEKIPADFNMTFIERSLVIDHVLERICIQTLRKNDTSWLQEVQYALEDSDNYTELRRRVRSEDRKSVKKSLSQSIVSKPEKNKYQSLVSDCQEYLHSGDSYELCLTGETKIEISANVHSWQLYQNLRRTNSAPFGSYLNLPGVSILSSSPERFLQWSRNGHCQLRPIKGTVKKGPGMTYEKASGILNTSKERAENLMIVDLIRHDLSGAIGAQSCEVTQLMGVEEYETVFQLVSVIEGKLPGSSLNAQHRQIGHKLSESENNTRDKSQARLRTSVSGLDVLRAALPPGSMTGAPKRRSCEILMGLEGRRRGIYSGVLGYMSVGGGGDFSVVIRTAFRHDTEKSVNGHLPGFRYAAECYSYNVKDCWQVGAGGAITVQSTAEGEHDEMEAKLDGVLKAFQQID